MKEVSVTYAASMQLSKVTSWWTDQARVAFR